VVGVVAWLVCSQLAVGLVALVLPWCVVNIRATRKLERDQELLREQLPDALAAISMCFSAGFSLQQAIQQTAAETPAPLGEELSLVASDMQAGVGVKEALEALEKRTQIADLRFLTVVLEIQHDTGGSLKELLERAEQSLAASFELARSLKVQTAQARMSSRLVSALPVVLVAILSVVMDGYLQAFFSSAAGMVILLVAVAMETAGILAIRKILSVDTE
jgi:tight adherence protein B